MTTNEMQCSEFGESLLTFKWRALAGVFYGLQENFTLDPLAWADLQDCWTVSSTNGLVSSFPLFHLPTQPGEQRFYRLVLLPP